MKLFAPSLYQSLSPKEKLQICNGCGLKGFGWIVPDSMYGLDISEACNIHDYMYSVGMDENDRVEADRVFRNNLIRIIEAKTRWTWLKFLRKRRAVKYFWAVQNFGGPAFWNNKNESEAEMVI